MCSDFRDTQYETTFGTVVINIFWFLSFCDGMVFGLGLARLKCVSFQLDADGELILLDRLFDPVTATGLVQGLDELRFRRLVIHGHLFHLGVAFLV